MRTPPDARQPTVIAPSLLSADFARLGEAVSGVLAAGADWIHVDVMDNHYVPNLTLGPMVCEAIKPHAGQAMLDVHLMVEPVDALIPMFAQAGAGLISVHPEATRHLHRTLALIRDCGCQAGLVFNPATPLAWLDDVMDQLDLVMLMSVNPGFGGQRFIPSTLPKLRQVRARLDAYAATSGRALRLEVDGGVKPGNIGAIAAAGADTFVAGSAVFGSADWSASIASLRAGAVAALGATGGA
ncbi:ribulose-phosphate 3-epimerase [Ideonella sp. DXS22W]|uniref:Ribulose-phosphate 3-epimerase n=1 Tax=Pseudaquabacterium inlustre TaxID=2984192 RepID=A0ABU9CCB8_9BURK